MRRIFTIISFLVSLYAAAQEQSLADVIVQGKSISLPLQHTSQSIQIISREEISNSPASSLQELLSYQAGVDVRQRGVLGVQADISIRGSSFEQMLILINGIRMSDAQTGHNTLSLPVDINAVERIEIIKGPAALRYGQNAYAGVINIVTKIKAADSFDIKLSGAAFNTYAIGAGINMGKNVLSHYLQANVTQSDGYRYNTDFTLRNAWYQNAMQLKNGSVRLQAGIIEKKFGANGFYATPAAKDQYEEQQTSLISTTLDKIYKNVSFNTNFYWRRSQDIYLYVRNQPEIYKNRHIGNNVGWETNMRFTSALGITGIGLDMRKEVLRSNNLGNRNHFAGAAFLEQRITLLQQKLDVTPAVNLTYYSDFKNFFYPGLSIGYRINNNSKVYFNTGKTYRIPSFTDLYYSSKTEQGNAALKPEQAISYEAGYRFITKPVVASIGLFARTSHNLIDWVKNNEQDVWTAQNIANMHTKGLEANAMINWNGWLQNVSVGYTYINNDVKVIDKPFSRYVLDNLRHQIVIQSHQRFNKRFSNQVVFRYNDRVSLKNYALVDDRVTFATGHLNIFVQVNNITATKYTETSLVPMPGRWLHAGVNFSGLF